MAPRPYSEKSSLPSDATDVIGEIPTQVLPESPSPTSFESQATTPSPTPQDQIPIETIQETVLVQNNNRRELPPVVPCYPTPGDIMPYDHSLPDFIRQITNEQNLANLQSLSLRVISTLISLHRMTTYLPNLRELDLEGSVLNSLRDIGCSLKNLRILKVGRCQLESLDGTFGLSSLKELYAQKNFITDVSPCSNLPHIRHIDVSGNRIRNISYAGFLSVCTKLKSIVFSGNPAAEVSDYRRHVRRILPQLETLDGVPLINEDNTDGTKEPELIENCEGSDTSSVEVPDFSSVSPSDSMNNLLESEEDALFLDKKNKQAKNLGNQDHSEQETRLHDDFQNLNLQRNQEKPNENRTGISKQKSVNVQKQDKDIENRSKKSSLQLNLYQERAGYSFSLNSMDCSLPSTSSTIHCNDTEKINIRPSTACGMIPVSAENRREEDLKSGAIKKRCMSAVSKTAISDDEQGAEQCPGLSKLTTGMPVCGNLTAALRNRKKISNAWDETSDYKPDDELEIEARISEGRSPDAQLSGAGDYFDSEMTVTNEEDLIEEDVLASSKKWRETFRRFRSNNRARWEEEDESDYSHLLGETVKPNDQ